MQTSRKEQYLKNLDPVYPSLLLQKLFCDIWGEIQNHLIALHHVSCQFGTRSLLSFFQLPVFLLLVPFGRTGLQAAFKHSQIMVLAAASSTTCYMLLWLAFQHATQQFIQQKPVHCPSPSHRFKTMPKFKVLSTIASTPAQGNFPICAITCCMFGLVHTYPSPISKTPEEHWSRLY